jgi:hypothetical protein
MVVQRETLKADRRSVYDHACTLIQLNSPCDQLYVKLTSFTNEGFQRAIFSTRDFVTT